MSKAEEKAWEAYPIVMSQYSDNCKEYDSNESDRLVFIEGYHQAEKDLELTWEDIKQICDIAFEEACRLQRNMKSSLIYKEQHYQEVLKRFNEERQEKSIHIKQRED